MTIDELLDVLDDTLEEATNLPFTGGKRVVDVEKLRDTIDEIRLNMPAEIRQAKGVLNRGQDQMVLTKNEMLIFMVLLHHQGEIVSRDDLMTELWDNSEYISDNALTVNISRLRAKLEQMGYPDVIETRKKQGYVLV